MRFRRRKRRMVLPKAVRYFGRFSGIIVRGRQKGLFVACWLTKYFCPGHLDHAFSNIQIKMRKSAEALNISGDRRNDKASFFHHSEHLLQRRVLVIYVLE